MSSANQEDRARTGSTDTIRQDLNTICMAREEAEKFTADTEDRRRSVAQCVYDTGWSKSKAVRRSLGEQNRSK